MVATAPDLTFAATRLRALLAQMRLSRAEAAALLRSIADEFDGCAVDDRVRAAAAIEAEALRAQGFSVGPGPRFEIRTHAAALMLGRSSGTLKNWRSAGVGPAWRSDGAGGVWYSVIELLAWSRMVTITAPADVV